MPDAIGASVSTPTRTRTRVVRSCSTENLYGRRRVEHLWRRRGRWPKAIAAEWNSQNELIDPARMPITRLANVVIDAVSDAPQPVADDIEKYLRSDLLFYRAEAPVALVEKQSRAWDPLIAWARDQFDARFVLATGVMYITQPHEAVLAVRAAIPTEPWRLAALSSMTTLTGSALLALALSFDVLDATDAWATAHVDEDWQMLQWGSDEIALSRRAFREAEFHAAATVLKLIEDRQP